MLKRPKESIYQTKLERLAFVGAMLEAIAEAPNIEQAKRIATIALESEHRHRMQSTRFDKKKLEELSATLNNGQSL